MESCWRSVQNAWECVCVCVGYFLSNCYMEHTHTHTQWMVMTLITASQTLTCCILLRLRWPWKLKHSSYTKAGGGFRVFLITPTLSSSSSCFSSREEDEGHWAAPPLPLRGAFKWNKWEKPPFNMKGKPTMNKKLNFYLQRRQKQLICDSVTKTKLALNFLTKEWKRSFKASVLWLIVWLLWPIINVVRSFPLLCWAKSLACINSHPCEPWKRRLKATLQVNGLS